MKLLQKILFVVMIGVFGWNVSGMIPPPPPQAHPTLNLPNNTPGLQGAFQNQIINTMANIRCHHVIIPGTAAGIAFNNAGGIANVNAARAAAMVIDGNIYFPRNGVQPTTAEALQYSCANVVDVNITDWYVRAFGGDTGVELSNGNPVPVADNAPPMGFRAGVGVHPHIIIANMGALNLNQQFWQEFRNIANTAPGRELLYRILIEIRRINPALAIANQHCYASGTERVGGMSLTVTHHAGHTVFVNKGSITFDNTHAGDLLNALQRYYSFLTTLATLPNDPHNPVLQTPHFVDENVINVPGATIANDQFTHVQIPMPGGAANANIYFPIDGHQPITPNAIAWSCANIDNRENSPITEWYMMMFGVMQHAGVHIQAGWNNAAVPNDQRIIDATLVGIDDLL